MSAANPFEPPKASLDVPVARDAPPLWNPDAAGAWSLLFTPMFGSVLVRRNWQVLEEPGKARTGTIWFAVSVVMFFATVVLGSLGFLYIIIWYFAFQRPQAIYVKERWGTNYPRRGWAMPVIFAVALYVVVFIVLIFVLSILGSIIPR